MSDARIWKVCSLCCHFCVSNQRNKRNTCSLFISYKGVGNTEIQKYLWMDVQVPKWSTCEVFSKRSHTSYGRGILVFLLLWSMLLSCCAFSFVFSGSVVVLRCCFEVEVLLCCCCGAWGHEGFFLVFLVLGAFPPAVSRLTPEKQSFHFHLFNVNHNGYIAMGVWP